MKKAEMKREFYRLASDAIGKYPYKPTEIIGDKVAEARWEEAKAEVSQRLARWAEPRRKK